MMSREIDETLKYALRTFSCRRVLGLDDPQIPRNSPNLSGDDDEDSLNFLEADDLGNRQLGPVIPEKDRATVVSVLEKMGLLWEQRMFNRISALQKWRLLRLSERLQQLRRHSTANLKLMGIFKKQHSAFYQLVAYSKGMNLNVDYSNLPKPDHAGNRSNIGAHTPMNDSSLLFNHSDIFETGDSRLNDELRSKAL